MNSANRAICQDNQTSKKRWISDIHPLNLKDNPASGKGQYTTLGILEPSIRIERTDNNGSDRQLDPSRGYYRIVLTFVLEIGIIGFSQSFQKYNRFFDSISLRYLFYHGEEYDLYPKPDGLVKGIQVTNEAGQAAGIDAGVTPSPMMDTAIPNLSVHAQRDFKITHQRKMNSWRMGLSTERHPQENATTIPPWSVAFYRGRRKTHSSFFQVLSVHKEGCQCRSYGYNACPLQMCDPYNRAARWFWQTEASLHLWTPEIYGSFSTPITVVRYVDVDVIERLKKVEDLRPFLHFDFEVETQIRELGWGWNFFKPTSRPAELRARTDSGQQMSTDRMSFCVTCCAEMINWPRYQTRNLQAEAEQEALHAGPSTSRRLKSNTEYGRYLKTRQEYKRRSMWMNNWQSPITPKPMNRGVDPNFISFAFHSNTPLGDSQQSASDAQVNISSTNASQPLVRGTGERLQPLDVEANQSDEDTEADHSQRLRTFVSGKGFS